MSFCSEIYEVPFQCISVGTLEYLDVLVNRLAIFFSNVLSPILMLGGKTTVFKF